MSFVVGSKKRGATPACLEVHLASRNGIEIVQAISLGERILETFLPRFGFSLGIDASAVREGFFEKLFHCHASFRLISPRQFFRGTRNIARNLKKAKCKSNESVSKYFQFSHIAERARYIPFRFNSKSDIKLANGKLKLKNSENPLCHSRNALLIIMFQMLSDFLKGTLAKAEPRQRFFIFEKD